MDKKMVGAINEQINHELYSAYLYLAMAAYCESVNLGGFAHWMRLQAKEETEHAMKFFVFLNDRGARVELEAIDKPPVSFTSPHDVFKKVYEHEKKVTGLIHKLYELAQKLNDHATAIELQWFITEQVEEEKNAQEIIAQLSMVKVDSPSLLIIDRNLGKRGSQE